MPTRLTVNPQKDHIGLSSRRPEDFLCQLILFEMCDESSNLVQKFDSLVFERSCTITLTIPKNSATNIPTRVNLLGKAPPSSIKDVIDPADRRPFAAASECSDF